MSAVLKAQQQSVAGNGSRPGHKSSGSGESGERASGLGVERSSGSSQQQSPAGNDARPRHKSPGSGPLPERTPRADDRHDECHAGATSSSELIPQPRKCIMDTAF